MKRMSAANYHLQDSLFVNKQKVKHLFLSVIEFDFFCLDFIDSCFFLFCMATVAGMMEPCAHGDSISERQFPWVNGGGSCPIRAPPVYFFDPCRRENPSLFGLYKDEKLKASALSSCLTSSIFLPPLPHFCILRINYSQQVPLCFPPNMLIYKSILLLQQEGNLR